MMDPRRPIVREAKSSSTLLVPSPAIVNNFIQVDAFFRNTDNFSVISTDIVADLYSVDCAVRTANDAPQFRIQFNRAHHS